MGLGGIRVQKGDEGSLEEIRKYLPRILTEDYL